MGDSTQKALCRLKADRSTESKPRLVSVRAATVAIPKIASAHAATGLSEQNEQLVRKFYAAWESKDWHALDILLTDDFTFPSPNDDDTSARASTRHVAATQTSILSSTSICS